jgi:hypothetical protein
MKTLSFCIASHSYQAHMFYAIVKVNQLVCEDVFLTSIAQVKCQCVIVAKMFVTELERCFVDSKLMNAFGIVYHQFWMQPNVKFSFSLHLNVIKRHY